MGGAPSANERLNIAGIGVAGQGAGDLNNLTAENIVALCDVDWAHAAGSFKINNRNQREWSIKYKVWLPYWQHFTSGMGFHETTTYLHNMGNGSHGCVNLLRSDAKELWNLIGYNTTVTLFGRRPGT